MAQPKEGTSSKATSFSRLLRSYNTGRFLRASLVRAIGSGGDALPRLRQVASETAQTCRSRLWATRSFWNPEAAEPCHTVRLRFWPSRPYERNRGQNAWPEGPSASWMLSLALTVLGDWLRCK